MMVKSSTAATLRRMWERGQTTRTVRRQPLSSLTSRTCSADARGGTATRFAV